jgi:hypothetical protein
MNIEWKRLNLQHSLTVKYTKDRRLQAYMGRASGYYIYVYNVSDYMLPKIARAAGYTEEDVLLNMCRFTLRYD